jgi:acetylornithine deacetylase
LTDAELLALHRELVAIPSVSREEDRISAFVADFLSSKGMAVERQGNNIFALSSPDSTDGKLICFNSHLDTVPPAPGWKREPHKPVIEDALDGRRIYGLGSNDAKASVAAMITAFVRIASDKSKKNPRLLLALTAQEEVGGKGAEALIPELKRRGLTPDAAIVGEPTELNIATAQKGLLILELVAKGQACHAAHRKKIGAPNAIRILAKDLTVLDEAVEAGALGRAHKLLGETTFEPTMVSGGTARNMNPAESACYIDIRVNPNPPVDVVATLRSKLKGSELKVFSDRLKPYEISEAHPFVAAALNAARTIKSDACTFGSRGLSDLVFFDGVAAVKAGPGVTERSHTADEFVLEKEILEGARFYEQLARSYGGGS